MKFNLSLTFMFVRKVGVDDLLDLLVRKVVLPFTKCSDASIKKNTIRLLALFQDEYADLADHRQSSKVGLFIRKDGLSGFEECDIARCIERIQQFRREIIGIRNPKIERVQPCLSTKDRDDILHGRFGPNSASADYKQDS
jgi:hypothetical protein